MLGITSEIAKIFAQKNYNFRVEKVNYGSIAEDQLLYKDNMGVDRPIGNFLMQSKANANRTISLTRVLRAKKEWFNADKTAQKRGAFVALKEVSTQDTQYDEKDIHLAGLYTIHYPKIEKRADLSAIHNVYIKDYTAWEKDVMLLYTTDTQNFSKNMLDVLSDKTTLSEKINSVIRERNKTTSPGVTKMAAESRKDRVLRLARQGAARGAISAVNKKLVDTLITSLGDSAPPWMHHQATHIALETLMPLIVRELLEFDTQNRFSEKYKDKLKNALEIAFDDAVARGSGASIELLLDNAKPLFDQFVNQATLALEGEPESTDLEENDDLEDVVELPLRARQMEEVGGKNL